MFIVKWRKRTIADRYGRISPVITGLRKYSTKDAAEAQVAKFQSVFPQNQYYVEPV